MRKSDRIAFVCRHFIVRTRDIIHDCLVQVFAPQARGANAISEPVTLALMRHSVCIDLNSSQYYGEINRRNTLLLTKRTSYTAQAPLTVTRKT